MKFGLQSRLFQAVVDGKSEEFVASLTPAEKIEVIRSLDNDIDGKNGLFDASSMYEKYTIYTDVLKMTLTQFIYLEYALKAGRAFANEVAAIIIRPKDEVQFDNTNQLAEENLSAMIDEEEYDGVSQIIQSMLRTRDYVLFTKFEGVVYNKLEPSEDEEEEKTGDVDFNERWFWYSIVRTLANEDLQKFQFVYDMRMSDVLVELAYRIQLAKKTENEQRAEEARNAARFR